jgi:tripartite ATP-independent transporter DctM subunit
MIDLSAGAVTVIMLVGMVLLLITGFPLAFGVGTVGLIVGILTRGFHTVDLIYIQLFEHAHGYTLLAAPMFVYMGYMLESTGIAESMYQALYLFMGRLRGGLAIITVAVGTVLAACVGVIGASVTMLAIVALPAMVKRGYSRSLAAGTVCASGTLGILIPPSIMLVVYGPMAALSVGKLFMAAFIPGFILAGLYALYIAIRCLIQPSAGPGASPDAVQVSLLKRFLVVLRAALPPAFVIMSVLGSIFFGLASPTEAAAFGGFATTLLVILYRKFTWGSLKNALTGTMRVTGMIFLIVVLSVAYTSVFLSLGGGDVVANVIVSAPGGRWGSFVIIMFIVFILGMFLDWIGIVFIMVPILAPTIIALEFNPLWFAMMVVINLQTGFMSPPFATSIFYLRGAAAPELGVEYGHIIKGVYPFITIVLVVITLCVFFPQIVLWLPGQMIR